MAKGNDLVKTFLNIFSNLHGEKRATDKCRRKKHRKHSESYLREVSDIQNILTELINEMKEKENRKASKKDDSHKGTSRNKISGSESFKSKKIYELYKRPNKSKNKISSTKTNEISTHTKEKLTSNAKISQKENTKQQKTKQGSPNYKIKNSTPMKTKNKSKVKMSLLSDMAIMLDTEIPENGFWNRSESSVRLIESLSSKLNKEPLENLLQKVNVSNEHVDTETVDFELTEKVPPINEKITNPLTKEEIIHTDGMNDLIMETEKETIVNSLNLKQSRRVLQDMANENLNKSIENGINEVSLVYKGITKSSTDLVNNSFPTELISSASFLELFGTPSSISQHGPSIMTVKEISDMLYSVALIFERLPDTLKQSRLIDLNPPETLFKTVSILSHITESLSFLHATND